MKTAQAKATPIADIEVVGEDRRLTQIGEFDRVLGGGVIPGSVILIGGDPGIGKTTLLLQALPRLSSKEEPVLYVSGEESPRQIKMRAAARHRASESVNPGGNLPRTNPQSGAGDPAGRNGR